jgi:Raf kinase inhibitor-like YbhB/YbcL family protein
MARWRTCATMCLMAISYAAWCDDVPGDSATDLVLASADIKNGHSFPIELVSNSYGCTGGNQSPALYWRGAPQGTRSFMITMYDPDEHGSPSGWWHWVVYDVPAGTDHLSRNAGTPRGSALPRGALQGRNDDGLRSYSGPCPDQGDAPHHYVVTIYALKIAKLPVPNGASGANVTYTASGYTLGTAKIVALHGRRASTP